MTQTSVTRDRRHSPDEIDLLELFLTLIKYRMMILSIVAAVFLISIVYTFSKPDIYTATARILPSRDSNASTAALFSQSAGFPANLFGGKTASGLYEGLLESRSVADKIIQKFKLKERYGKTSMEGTYKQLSAQTNIEASSETQIVSVSVDDEDPVLAADIANAYLDALDEVNRNVNVSTSHSTRVFLENRLEKVNADLIEAESNLRVFQEKHGLISISDQARAAIEGASRIKAEIIMSQAELSMLRRLGTKKQKDVAMLSTKIAELQKQLERIESGNPSDDSLYIPFNLMPAIGMELAKLTREAKVQEEIFKLITNQYELAKIEEAKDFKTVQVLDHAVAPDRKSGTNRRFIVLFSTGGGLLFAMLLAFCLEYLQRLRTDDEERYRRLSEIIRFRRPRTDTQDI
ncbi:GumC family protein [Thermodesulfobacteriota bacterium]